MYIRGGGLRASAASGALRAFQSCRPSGVRKGGFGKGGFSN